MFWDKGIQHKLNSFEEHARKCDARSDRDREMLLEIASELRHQGERVEAHMKNEEADLKVRNEELKAIRAVHDLQLQETIEIKLALQANQSIHADNVRAELEKFRVESNKTYALQADVKAMRSRLHTIWATVTTFAIAGAWLYNNVIKHG